MANVKAKFRQSEMLWLFSRAVGFGQVAATQEQLKEKQEHRNELIHREHDVWAALKLLKKQATRNDDGSWIVGPKDLDATWETPLLNIGEQERDGIFWLLCASLDPASPLKVTVGMADEIVWPIAEKIRRTLALAKELKLDPSKRTRIEDDPEPEELRETSDSTVSETNEKPAFHCVDA